LINEYSQIYCTSAGLFYASTMSSENDISRTCNNDTSGERVVLRAPAQSQRCDGVTSYNTSAGIGGSAVPGKGQKVVATANTDNTIVIELLGSPTKGLGCNNVAGASTWCFDQA